MKNSGLFISFETESFGKTRIIRLSVMILSKDIASVQYTTVETQNLNLFKKSGLSVVGAGTESSNHSRLSYGVCAFASGEGGPGFWA